MSKEFPFFKYFIGWWLAVIILLALGRATTTSSTKKNATGYIAYQDNPLTYKEGAVIAAAFVGSEHSPGIVVRIQPRGTYSLYTEDILFCGAPAEMFMSKKSPMVLAYETVAHSTIEGIGCHRLVSVDEVKSIKGDWQ